MAVDLRRWLHDGMTGAGVERGRATSSASASRHPSPTWWPATSSVATRQLRPPITSSTVGHPPPHPLGVLRASTTRGTLGRGRRCASNVARSAGTTRHNTRFLRAHRARAASCSSFAGLGDREWRIECERQDRVRLNNAPVFAEFDVPVVKF